MTWAKRYHGVGERTCFSGCFSRIVAFVLTELCQRTLTAERLDALPATLRRRSELAALRYAVHVAGGDRDAAGRTSYLAALAFNLARLQRLEALLAAARDAGIRLVPIKGASLLQT